MFYQNTVFYTSWCFSSEVQKFYQALVLGHPPSSWDAGERICHELQDVPGCFARQVADGKGQSAETTVQVLQRGVWPKAWACRSLGNASSFMAKVSGPIPWKLGTVWCIWAIVILRGHPIARIHRAKEAALKALWRGSWHVWMPVWCKWSLRQVAGAEGECHGVRNHCFFFFSFRQAPDSGAPGIFWACHPGWWCIPWSALGHALELPPDTWTIHCEIWKLALESAVFISNPRMFLHSWRLRLPWMDKMHLLEDPIAWQPKLLPVKRMSCCTAGLCSILELQYSNANGRRSNKSWACEAHSEACKWEPQAASKAEGATEYWNVLAFERLFQIPIYTLTRDFRSCANHFQNFRFYWQLFWFMDRRGEVMISVYWRMCQIFSEHAAALKIVKIKQVSRTVVARIIVNLHNLPPPTGAGHHFHWASIWRDGCVGAPKPADGTHNSTWLASRLGDKIAANILAQTAKAGGPSFVVALAVRSRSRGAQHSLERRWAHLRAHRGGRGPRRRLSEGHGEDRGGRLGARAQNRLPHHGESLGGWRRQRHSQSYQHGGVESGLHQRANGGWSKQMTCWFMSFGSPHLKNWHGRMTVVVEPCAFAGARVANFPDVVASNCRDRLLLIQLRGSLVLLLNEQAQGFKVQVVLGLWTD